VPNGHCCYTESPNPNEQIVDDGDGGFSTTDAWNWFANANSFQLDKHTHDPNGLSPDGVLLDDADASTEVYRGWVSGTHTGAQGGSYRYHDPSAFSAETVALDDADPSTVVVGSWNTGTMANAINGSHRWTNAGTGTKSVTWDPELRIPTMPATDSGRSRPRFRSMPAGVTLQGRRTRPDWPRVRVTPEILSFVVVLDAGAVVVQKKTLRHGEQPAGGGEQRLDHPLRL
jgi:hypothetical protein